MKLKLMLGALVCVLGACGGSDGSGKGGGSASGLACITIGDDGRPAVCTVYTGDIFDPVSSMDFFCPKSKVIRMERAKSCPGGEGLVGYCTHSPGEEGEMQVYSYLYDEEHDAAAAYMRDACEAGEGIWNS